MVHSPAYGFPLPMCSAAGRTPSGVPVTRFGRPRITATLQLPAAYRSLPRPSSPGGSKASSTDPPLLDHIILPALSLFFQTSFHWRQGGSNPRPSACKADALASWAMPPHSPRDRGKGEELPSGRRPPTHREAIAPPPRGVRGAVTFLSRKEVIQPHLPVRLPCYDFTPLAGHTFGSGSSCELAYRLRVSPTRMV